MSAEKAIANARCIIFYYDGKIKNWAPSPLGNAYGVASIYENGDNNTFRVIGRGLTPETQKTIAINSSVTKDSNYSKASDTFHQWSDGKNIYGINIYTKEEADVFAKTFLGVIDKLKGGSSAPPPPPPNAMAPTTIAPATQFSKQTPSKQEFAAVKKAVQPAPTPARAMSTDDDAPPPPPPPPPAEEKKVSTPAPVSTPEPASEGGDERSALLASIRGFKGGLKKAETNDRSTPVLKGDDPAKSSSSASSGGGGGPANMMGAILAAKKAMSAKQAANSPKVDTPPSKVATPLAAPAPKKVSTPSPVMAPKVEPVKASPVVPVTSAPVTTKVSAVNTSGGLTMADLEAFKESILEEIRREIHAAKEEILQELRNR